MRILTPHLALCICAAVTLLTTTTRAQITIDRVLIGKTSQFQQTSASAPVSGTAFAQEWYAEVAGSGAGFSTMNPAPTVTPASGSTSPTVTLVYDSGDAAWNYAYSNPSGAVRNSLFANGTYGVSANGNSISLNLGLAAGTPALTIPGFTLTGGAWSGGTYVIDVSQPLRIVSNTFTQFSANVDGHIGFDLETSSSSPVSGGSVNYLYSDNIAANNYIDLTFNNLVAGTTYYGWLGYAAVVDKNSTGGSLNFAYQELATNITITAIPEPSTYAALAGFGALGLALWRRRRQALRNPAAA